jgi:hypothetical protein
LRAARSSFFPVSTIAVEDEAPDNEAAPISSLSSSFSDDLILLFDPMLSHAPPFCGGKSMGGAGMVGGAGEEIFELKHFLV